MQVYCTSEQIQESSPVVTGITVLHNPMTESITIRGVHYPYDLCLRLCHALSDEDSAVKDIAISTA